MEKLPMCRMCLVDKVPMFRMVNRNLHDLYEKLTDNPFVTDDCRPILACSFCYAKLKQCYRLLIQCLEAEERFAQRMNEDYKGDYLINQDLSGFFCGFSKSPIQLISIVEECQTESIAAKVELPAVSEIIDDIIEPKEEYQSEELEPETLDNSCLNIGDIPPLHSELDLEYDVPLVEFKIEVDEQEVTEKIQKASDTIKLEPETFDNSSLVVHIPPHYSESDSEDDVPLMEFKTEAVEEQEVKEKKQGVRDTKRTTVGKKTKLEPRKIKPEGAITAEQTEKQKLDSKIIHTARKRSPKSDTYFKEPYIHTGTQIGEKPHQVCQRSFSHKDPLLQHIRIHTGENPYKCHVCLLDFDQKNKLTNHIRVHTGEKPYKCDVCSHSFSSRSNLLRHIRVHTGRKPYKCNLCQRSFNEKDDLIKHIRIHTGEKPYKCDVCPRSFIKKFDLLRHMRIHTGEKPYKCNVCKRSFNQNGDLTQHIRLHTGEKPYKCHICLLGFTQKKKLTNHIRVHTGEKPYKCDICSRTFTYKCDLLSHIRTHTGEKPYKCNVCESSFSQSGALTKHIRIHTGEKPYKCDVCTLSFSARNNLLRHIRIHSGEKPYKCDVCPRSFTYKCNLLLHIRIHTGEKPYKCNVCERSFSQSGALTKHIRIHTGEKPYKCDICQLTFKQKNSLTTHIRIHTGEKP